MLLLSAITLDSDSAILAAGAVTVKSIAQDPASCLGEASASRRDSFAVTDTADSDILNSLASAFVLSE